tara:strand:+ start:478 stop:1059 length:582 start_codon:yes stop_codon:yes gene_type:complete
MIIESTDNEIIDDGFIYFILDGVKPHVNLKSDWDERSYLKIGYSKNPELRLGALQTASAKQLDLMGYIPGNVDIEKHLHELFGHLRQKGEWFALTRQLYTCINQFELINHHQKHKPAVNRKRVYARLKTAKQKVVKRGRPRSLHKKTGAVLEERRNGLGVRAIARKLQMAPSSVHKILNPASCFSPKIIWKHT